MSDATDKVKLYALADEGEQHAARIEALEHRCARLEAIVDSLLAAEPVEPTREQEGRRLQSAVAAADRDTDATGHDWRIE